MTDAATPLRPPRIVAIDLARGAALIAMFVYHLAWDAHYFGFSASDPSAGGWKIFSHLIAASFLFIAGLSMALALAEQKPLKAITTGLARVAAAALAVSAATYFFAPEAFISFGILHCIVVASLAALALRRAPAAAVALLAIAAIAAPQLTRSAAFDGPWLSWLGLSATTPRTLDWRPLLPWGGALLAGVVAGRLFGARLANLRAPVGLPPLRALAFAGRHTLAIYLLHQPAFLALLFALNLAVRNADERETAPFLTACGRACVDTGRTEALCVKSCACVATWLKDAGLWQAAMRDALDAGATARLRQKGQDCRATAE